MAEDCIFCSIASRAAPAHILWEDEHTMAFLDIFPLSRGHTLVIPKRHIDRLTELPPAQYGAMLGAVSEMCRRIEQLTVNYNVGINQGAIAGQIVFHLHFHIIPRYREGEAFPRRRLPLDPADAAELSRMLSNGGGRAPPREGTAPPKG